MPRKKPTHGGSRPGAGRPKSPPTEVISFRVSRAQHAELTKAGKRRKLTANQEAKRRAVGWLEESEDT